MAFSVGTVEATIGANMKPFERAMGRVRSMGRAMVASITLPLAAVGGAAIKTAADYETLRQSMNALNGSAEEGARQFERLKRFSATTPFQLKELADAQNMLQGFGQTADDAFESMKMIGDIAAITGSDIEGIGIAFGQAAAEGRLMTRDIRQLINQGVPAIKLLAETMGVAQSEVLDLASEGKISFEILQQAFREATSEGGMFANGMERQSKTLAGIFSTLKDNVSIALGEIGKSLSETFDIKGIMSSLITNIQQGINWFNSLSDETRRAAFIMAGVLGAAGPVMAAVGSLTLAIGAISAPIAGVVAAVGAGAALMITHWEDVEDYFTSGGGAKMWSELKEIISNTVEVVTDLWSRFGDNIMSFTEGAFNTIIQIVETALSAINDTIAVWTNLYQGEYEKAFVRAESSWRDHMGSLGNIVQTGLLALRNIDVLGGYKLWEWLGIIPDQQEINARYAKTMQGAVESARQAATGRGESVIIPAEIDFSGFSLNLGDQMGIFEGASNPIDQATASAVQFGTSINEAVIPNLQNMKATVATNTEGMTLLQIGAMKTRNQLSATAQAGARMGNMIGQALSQAVFHAQNLGSALANLAKQFASRVLMRGLSLLLSGGFSGLSGLFGKNSFFSGIFHQGGVVPGSGESLALVQGGEGIFTPNQMKALGNSGGGASPAAMERAFSRALAMHTSKLGPEDIYILTQKGKNRF